MHQSDREQIREVIEQVNRVILGKRAEVQEVVLALLANGHVLLEDIPGVGKTTLALAVSRAFALECRRMQFTPDVTPSDLTGFSIYRRDQERFVYEPGTVFTNLLLADEINRTSPKTQSALLEVMEERRVTVEGVTREVPSPFFVIATQNPKGAAGTQPLPEAQMDRFLISVTLGYPDFESELAMAMAAGEKSRPDDGKAVCSRETLLQLQREIHRVYMNEAVYRYVLGLITATRNHPYIERGVSPRGTIALVVLAKAAAWLDGRDYVTPKDVRGQFAYVASHRVIPDVSAEAEQISKAEILAEILAATVPPPVGDPG